MHDTALKTGGSFFTNYLSGKEGAKILELGSMDVNGSFRALAPSNSSYVGIDIEAGRGVDIVYDGKKIPFDDEHFDVVMASSVFEHDTMFWLTFIEMLRVTKPDGLIYINAPSNGKVHRYPKDCWRFYPDAGVCLAEWGRKSGYDVTLVESFIARREKDIWNDFCAVFARGKNVLKPIKFLHEVIPSMNAWRFDQEKIINPVAPTEDMQIISFAVKKLNNK